MLSHFLWLPFTRENKIIWVILKCLLYAHFMHTCCCLMTYEWINKHDTGIFSFRFIFLNCLQSSIPALHAVLQSFALSQSLVHMAVQHRVISLDTALFAANLQQCGKVIFSPAWGRLLLCSTVASYLKILTVARVTDQILVKLCPYNCSVHTSITIFRILSALKYLLLSKVKRKINITEHFLKCR
jgi:hypothetical protein